MERFCDNFAFHFHFLNRSSPRLLARARSRPVKCQNKTPIDFTVSSVNCPQVSLSSTFNLFKFAGKKVEGFFYVNCFLNRLCDDGPKTSPYRKWEMRATEPNTRASCPPATCPTDLASVAFFVVGDTGKIALSCQIAIEEGRLPSFHPINLLAEITKERIGAARARAPHVARRRPTDFGLARPRHDRDERRVSSVR